MRTEKVNISTQAVARSFSAAAASYDGYADLQRDVVNELVASIDNDIFGNSVGKILNVGSGTGYCCGQLASRFPNAHIVNLDIAEGMVRYHKKINNHSRVSFVSADVASLPFVKGEFDLVFSSLAIQWCANTFEIFSQLRQVCSSNAGLFLSTLGPATLMEVKHLWNEVDDFRHVNSFLSEPELFGSIEKAGLVIKNNTTQLRKRHYSTFKQLSAELKGLGAHNINSGQPKGLMGKNKWSKLLNEFDSRKKEGVFTTGFEVLLLNLSVVQ